MTKKLSSRLPMFVLLGFLVALIVYLQWPKPEENRSRGPRVVPVKTVIAAKSDFRDVVEAIGTTRANEQVLITSKYADIIEEILFSDGQLVKEGDVLVRLNSEEEEAKVKELEANLAESMAQYNRYQDLLKQKAMAKSQVDQKEAQAKAIAAQLLSARTRLNALTITAPFDGLLGFREYSVGAYLNAGTKITTIDDIHLVKVDFTIPEKYLTSLESGQVIHAKSTAYQSTEFVGKVVSVDSRVDPRTRTLRVRAEIPNENYKLRPGMLLQIQVERNVDDVLQVPESAIIPIEDKHYVYSIENDIATRKTVTIGRRQPGVVEVLSGIDIGEEIVIEGALKLRDGRSVKVLEDK